MFLLSTLLPAPVVAVGQLAPAGSHATARLHGVAVTPHPPTRAVNYLIAGVAPDYRAPGVRAPEHFRGNTDSLLLLQLDPVSNTVRTLSLPRDTRVWLPGFGWGKLNSALPRLGPDGMVRTVERLTGLHLQAYVLVNLDGVRHLTDALGGVDIYVPQNMTYDDTAANLHIHLTKGWRHLSGVQAEQFVRFRHDAMGDIGRAQRQQTFVNALARRLLAPSGAARLGVLPGVLQRDIRTNAGARDLSAALGMALHWPRVETFFLPGRFLTVNRGSFWEMDATAARRTLANFGGAPATAAARDVRALRVALISSGGTAAQLARVQERLWQAGYRRIFVSRREVPPGRASAVLSNASASEASRVRRDLGFGVARASGQGSVYADVTVWVGWDAVPRPLASRGKAPPK
ncbi:LCP family protein [Deinococcus sonorensis]|uniref:LCP family protein n=2 Tax=Deinococcus sonorensis TaxID=309891 RepID=A0AAU7UC65_9DEIO